MTVKRCIIRIRSDLKAEVRRSLSFSSEQVFMVLMWRCGPGSWMKVLSSLRLWHLRSRPLRWWRPSRWWKERMEMRWVALTRINAAEHALLFLSRRGVAVQEHVFRVKAWTRLSWSLKLKQDMIVIITFILDGRRCGDVTVKPVKVQHISPAILLKRVRSEADSPWPTVKLTVLLPPRSWSHSLRTGLWRWSRTWTCQTTYQRMRVLPMSQTRRWAGSDPARQGPVGWVLPPTSCPVPSTGDCHLTHSAALSLRTTGSKQGRLNLRRCPATTNTNELAPCFWLPASGSAVPSDSGCS